MRLYAITHTHHHGTDLFHVLADTDPDPAAVVASYGSLYEPDRGEELEVREVLLPACTLHPSNDRDPAGFYPVT